MFSHDIYNKDSHPRNLCLRGSLSAAPEDRPLPEIQAGHTPHGERPKTANHEAARPRDHETDIQKTLRSHSQRVSTKMRNEVCHENVFQSKGKWNEKGRI